MKNSLLVVCAVLGCWGSAAAQRSDWFSVDPASPEVPATVGAADIIDNKVPVVAYTASELGLPAGSNIDALSHGGDRIFATPLPPQNLVRVQFSVDRSTVGKPGSVIESEALGTGAAGDYFQVYFTGSFSTPVVKIKDSHDLMLTPANQSDLDSLSAPHSPIYFSVDPPTAALLQATVPGVTAGDILIQPSPHASAPPPTIFRSAADLFIVGKDIDALAFNQHSGTIWVSFSPLTAAPQSPAAIYQLRPTFQTVRPASDLDLEDFDNLNALRASDPGPGSVPALTRHGTLLMVTLFLLAMLVFLTRRS